MKTLNIDININEFKLIWNSLHLMEKNLINAIEACSPDSTESALLFNDLAELRLYIEDLKESAEGIFSPGVFNLFESS